MNNGNDDYMMIDDTENFKAFIENNPAHRMATPPQMAGKKMLTAQPLIVCLWPKLLLGL